MSKFLKFIIHLVIFATIICILALVVPPFCGITTAVVETPEEETNLPLGSVTYAKNVDVQSLKPGDSVLYQGKDSQTYRYTIKAEGTEKGIYTVSDPTDPKAEDQTITLRNQAPKIIITIGYIGYLLVATHSIEGMIILGLAVLFLIILFIISELWRKDRGGRGNAEAAEEEEEEIGGDEEEGLKSKKQLRREEKERKRQLKEEDLQILQEEKQRKKESKKRKKAAKKAGNSGGFIEDYEPEEPASTPEQIQPVHEKLATEEAHEELKKEIAAATEEIIYDEEEGQEITAAPQEMIDDAQEYQEVEEEFEEPEPVEIKKMAIPRYTKEELLRKAQEAGENPKVVEDEIAGVTLLDYSEIIGGSKDDE